MRIDGVRGRFREQPSRLDGEDSSGDDQNDAESQRASANHSLMEGPSKWNGIQLPRINR